jgi:NADPH-dependent F420 reductase
MKVTIIGAGNMARGIGSRLVASGNHVTITGRNPEKVGELVGTLQKAANKGAAVKTLPYGTAISDEVVVLAVPYPADVNIVKECGDKLAGKTIIDICTPLNSTYDGLTTPAGSSAAEEVGKVAPAGAKVVKAFVTNFAQTLADGQVAGQPLDVFVAGDDAEAKKVVTQLIESSGLRPLDAGGLLRARYLEGLHLINVGLQSKMQKPWMNAIKFVG